MEKLQIKFVRSGAQLPTYGSADAVGADLYACLEAPVVVQPYETVFIPTGLAVAIPSGCAGLIYARSSMGTKRGLAPANKVGVIDPDYRGEVMVALHNHSTQPQTINPGERIAQMLITPVLTPAYEAVPELDSTTRGAGGFGSTGA